MFKVSKFVFSWVYVSIFANLILSTILVSWFINEHNSSNISSSVTPHPSTTAIATAESDSEEVASPSEQSGGKLTYKQWVELLGKEAKTAARKKPERLTILVGDSISLWFPNELLPIGPTWLNQSISGESTAGLLKRLNLLEQTQPQVIFVMIGINDLIKGISDEEVLDTYEKIVQKLQRSHPKSKIVVQSILPHAGERMKVETREQLLRIPNERIQQLNQKLADLAQKAGVFYLDLQPMFADNKGFLRSTLTTDGLHLNRSGYWVWRTAIQTLSQFALDRKS